MHWQDKSPMHLCQLLSVARRALHNTFLAQSSLLNMELSIRSYTYIGLGWHNLVIYVCVFLSMVFVAHQVNVLQFWFDVCAYVHVRPGHVFVWSSILSKYMVRQHLAPPPPKHTLLTVHDGPSITLPGSCPTKGITQTRTTPCTITCSAWGALWRNQQTH